MLFALASCQDDYKFDSGFTLPTELNYPSSLMLDVTSEAPIILSWNGAADDGGIVLYEVLFDKQDGDFTSPLAVVKSDQGAKNQLTTTHAFINTIARKAGIRPEESGSIKWTVRASKGGVSNELDKCGIIAVTRGEGIDNLPTELFLFGNATENGGKKGLPFRCIGDGVYQIYTALSSGEIELKSSEESDAFGFYIDETGKLRDGELPTPVEGSNKVSRITVDFNTLKMTIDEIGRTVRCIWGATFDNIAELKYVGNGNFVGDGNIIFIHPSRPETNPPSWLSWTEERYYFLADVNGSEKCWGRADDVSAERPVGDEPEYFYSLHEFQWSQWDHLWKMAGNLDMKHATITIHTNHNGLMMHTFTDIKEATPPEVKVVFHEEAYKLFQTINECYGITSGTAKGFYNENYPKQANDNPASYLWPYDGLVTGAANLYKLGYTDGYVEMVDRFDAYYAPSMIGHDVGGYSSTTTGRENAGGTRFYDDNSIVGLDLVEAYNLTKDTKYLAKAKQVVEFLKSGEDDIHGGGLWWNEDAKNMSGNGNSNKPTCANGYATNFLLRYYLVCPDSEKEDVLDFAKRLYNWLVENLRDADGTYFNDRQANGTINKTKWTYNTGVMVSNGVLLYNITDKKEYLDQAKQSADGGYNHFVRPHAELGYAYPNHDPWFTVKLVNAFIEIIPYHSNATQYVETFIEFTKHALKKARNSNGLFREDWTGVIVKPERDRTLLMQDAALEALTVISLYKREK